MLKAGIYALVALALIQTLIYFPQMPALVASHFDGQGAANGWSSRGGFFGLYLAMLALLVVVFVHLPRWTERRGLKVPQRDYWMAPERAPRTRAWYRRQMLINGIAHLLLVIGVVQLVITANLAEEPRLSSLVSGLLGAYFVFLVGWLISFYWHFRRPS